LRASTFANVNHPFPWLISSLSTSRACVRVAATIQDETERLDRNPRPSRRRRALIRKYTEGPAPRGGLFHFHSPGPSRGSHSSAHRVVARRLRPEGGWRLARSSTRERRTASRLDERQPEMSTPIVPAERRQQPTAPRRRTAARGLGGRHRCAGEQHERRRVRRRPAPRPHDAGRRGCLPSHCAGGTPVINAIDVAVQRPMRARTRSRGAGSS